VEEDEEESQLWWSACSHQPPCQGTRVTSLPATRRSSAICGGSANEGLVDNAYTRRTKLVLARGGVKLS